MGREFFEIAKRLDAVASILGGGWSSPNRDRPASGQEPYRSIFHLWRVPPTAPLPALHTTTQSDCHALVIPALQRTEVLVQHPEPDDDGAGEDEGRGGGDVPGAEDDAGVDDLGVPGGWLNGVRSGSVVGPLTRACSWRIWGPRVWACRGRRERGRCGP